MKRITWLLAALLAVPAHAGVYKCAVGGKTVFQDRPCANAESGGQIVLSTSAVGKASGSAAAPSAGPSATGAKPTPQEINDAWLKGVEKDEVAKRKASKIRTAEIERDDLVRRIDLELQILRLKNTAANNNLAGATYEHSLSAEMQAVSTSYDTKIRSKEEEIKRLRAEP